MVGLLILLALLNTAAFVAYGWDKFKAKARVRRIPEAVLLALALFGGGVGALLGMHLFRHKTKHLLFGVTVPICAVIDLTVALLALKDLAA